MANPTPEQLAATYENDKAIGLPQGTTARQFSAESAWNPAAVSPAGAMGYAQVMPATLASLNARLGTTLDPHDFDDSLTIQRELMSENLKHFGNIADAARAYNGGWDKSTWGNDETAAYPGKLGLAGGGTGGKLPSGIAGQAVLTAGAQDTINSVIARTKNDSASLDATLGSNDMRVMDAAEAEGGSALAQATHDAGAGETFTQTFGWNTITGRLADAFEQEPATPNWTMSTDQKTAMAADQPGVWGNDDLRKYVEGSTSDAEYARRLTNAAQRADFEERAANTTGLKSASNTAIGLVAGMSDPIMLAATLGTGAVVNTARAAFISGTATRLEAGLMGAAGGAAGNIMADAAVTKMNNGDINWPELFQQGLVGAALGGAGGFVFHGKAKGAGASTPETDIALRGASDTNDSAIQRQVAEAGSQPLAGDRNAIGERVDGTVGTSLDEFGTDKRIAGTEPRPGMTDLTDPGAQKLALAMESVEARRAAREDAAKAENGPTREDAAGQSTEWEPADNMVGPVDRRIEIADAIKAEEQAAIPEQTIRIPEGTPQPDIGDAALKGRTARGELARMAASTDDPMVKALAGRLGEQLKQDVPILETTDMPVQAHYNGGEHHIVINGATPDHIILHEISHAATLHKLAYGLANPDSIHGELTKGLEAIRKQAKAAYTGNDRDAKYYLNSLHEFVAGLYSGHGDFVNHLRNTKVKGGNVLSKAVDIVRSLLGISPKETNGLTRAMGLTDHLIDQPLRQHIIGGEAGFQTVHYAPPTRNDVRLAALGEQFKQGIDSWTEVKPAETAGIRAKADKWYNGVRAHAKLDKAGMQLFDSVGLKLGLSKNKGVRMWASDLGEDATGNNRQHATSAAIDKVRYQAGWRTPAVEALHNLMPELMTPKEKALWSAGFGNDVEKNIGKQVAIERLKHRAAVQSKQKFVSSAPDAVRKLGGVMDSFWKDISEQGKAAGSALATAIHDAGHVGHIPYNWDSVALTRAYNEDIPKFNSFKSLLTDQYTKKVLDPAMDKLMNVGPQDPAAIATLRQTVGTKVDHLTDNYLRQIMRDPESRVKGRDDHFGDIASQLLMEDWQGGKITQKLADDFRSSLKDHMADRTRTEFDLTAPHADGTTLLDFMDTDLGRMIDSNSSKFAGDIALAQRGLTDPNHIVALKDALHASGATDEEIQGIDFLTRSLTDDLNNKEFAAAKLLQAGAHMSMMGKLGLNALADAASVIASNGVTGFVKTLTGGVMNRDTALMRQLKVAASSALGLDHRLHLNDTSRGVLRADGLLSQGSTFQRMIGAGQRAVGLLSGMRHVSQIVHRGYLPVLTEDMHDAVKSSVFSKGTGNFVIEKTSKGLTPARLADMGISGDMAERIQRQLAKHDAGRKAGDAINWDQWDDQHAADSFIGAIHRGAGQALQRSFIGETPQWLSEGTFGKMAGQFKRYGVTAAEKQFMRNLFINDANTYTGFAVSTAWGAMLYNAKMQMNTVAMNDAQREKYLTEHLHGWHLASGVGVMVNMAGLLPDGIDAMHVLLGGQTQGSGSPIASIGFAENLRAAAGAAGGSVVGAATGHGIDTDKAVDYVGNARKLLRIVPGGNTVFGTALSNEINSDHK